MSANLKRFLARLGEIQKSVKFFRAEDFYFVIPQSSKTTWQEFVKEMGIPEREIKSAIDELLTMKQANEWPTPIVVDNLDKVYHIHDARSR